MEVGTEISQKIRSAIKAKLLELGSYVDDELPDYIMVMVANKKSRSQMNGDLGLFLGTNTDAFTVWLHGLLEKLQTITIGSDKLPGKTEKPKSSKKKEKDKMHKGDLSGKKSSKDRNKTECTTGSNSNKVTDSSNTTQPESAEETKTDSPSSDEHSQHKPTVEVSSFGVGIEKAASEPHIIREDIEDVRELLVTETGEDELAEELETTEAEVVNLQAEKDTAKLPKVSKRDIGVIHSAKANTSQSSSTRSQSPEIHNVQESTVTRKRKAPTSVVASVSQRIGNDEEYDPHNPTFGSVASVVKVTARKSSIPPLLQANRVLLLKAMKEAENSVAAKKRVVMTKRLSRDNSPAEVYSPQRKRSDLSHDQASPPPYIPSKKAAVNRNSGSQHSGVRVLTRNDARHMLSRDTNRELVSKSKQEKVVETVDSDPVIAHRKERSRSPEINRRLKESGRNNREVRSGKDFGGDKNFQITCHLSSDPELDGSHHFDSRKRPHSRSPSQEPKQNLKVKISSSSAQDSKSKAARLGKLVIERNGSDEDVRDSIHEVHPVNSTTQRDARDSINARESRSVTGTVQRDSRESHSVSSTAQRDARDTINARDGRTAPRDARESHPVSSTAQRDARDSINARESRSVTGTAQRDSRESHTGTSTTQRDARDTINAKGRPVTSTVQRDARDTIKAKDQSATSTVQRDARETIKAKGHSTTSTVQRDAREDIVAKVGKSTSNLIHKSSNSRLVSNLGMQAFQKQCEAAVISVQAAEVSNRAKRSMYPDSRIVECDTQTLDEDNIVEHIKKNKESDSNKLKITASTDIVNVAVGDRNHDDESGDDDLSKMIDEDLGPELLDNTNDDEFNLDLDIDEDLSHVVGVKDNKTMETDLKELDKDEKRLGTKFIVTLDGIDERQFHSDVSVGMFSKHKHPSVRSEPPVLIAPVTTVLDSVTLHNHFTYPMAPEQLQQNHNLYLDILGAQGRLSQAQLQTSLATIPSKLTPPKIQPFSISLKDSDDEHDDKEGKPSVAIQEDYYEQQPEGEAVANKRAKVTERCKFWPACAAGASCEYHHPTAHCKTFPNCSFGDKCLFIHPNCRFDSKCARPDCPYTHTSRRPALTSAAHVIPLPPSHFVFSALPPKPKFVPYPSTQTVCHYFPNCQNMNCRFLHPKPCKFGTVCKSPACPFYHPPMPGKDKLKWQANSGQLKADVPTIPSSSVKVEPTVDKLSPTITSNSAAVSSTSQ